jgi:environmental stress-induced protein Ves
MEIIRFENLKPEPWGNGGGVTREIARQAAADGGWDWRLSLADVTKAGEFSVFAGMQRLLTVVEGDLLLLNINGSEHAVEKYRPFRLDGDAATSAKLPTGDVRNLNVITRSGAFKAYTSIIELSKKRAQPLWEGQFGVLLQGQGTVADETHDAESLARYDSVVGSDVETPEILGRGFLAVVSIDPADDAG